MTLSEDQFKTMLVELSGVIDDDDLERMKFKCNDIGKRIKENISSALLLFEALEERGKLSRNNIAFLRNLLETCCAGKTVGLDVVNRYYGGGQPVYSSAPHQPMFHNHLPTQQNFQQPPQFPHHQVPHERFVGNAHRPREYRGPDLTREFGLLTRSLTKDWKFFMRALGVPDDDIEAISSDHQQIREKIHHCFLLWQGDLQESASRAKLIEACKSPSVKRMDLVAKLQAL